MLAAVARITRSRPRRIAVMARKQSGTLPISLSISSRLMDYLAERRLKLD